MNVLGIDISTLLLGLLAAFLLAECLALFTKLNAVRNNRQSAIDTAVADERVKAEKKRSELEMMLKERELELKAEYEELLSLGREAKRKEEERVAAASGEFEKAQAALAKANAAFKRYENSAKLLDEKRSEYIKKLDAVASLDPSSVMEEAKRELKLKCEDDLKPYRQELLERSQKDIESQARSILAAVMQRAGADMPGAFTSAIVKIPDDAMKGRLIGKEGRNIRSFESETETTLVIDETPDSVMVSSFNPVRREVARIALERLVEGGRINPSTIEAAVADARASVADRALELGSEAVDSLGITGVDGEIKTLLGRLGFHLSLNQNTLAHSLETASFCSMIASEMKLDAALAKRIGLFHDIGKAVCGSDASHARAGAEVLARAGESPIVCNAVASHHGEVPAESLYAVVLRIADTLSASRPGARMEALDGYIRRIKTLESAAMEFEGVASAYVMQAGRELRVIVSPEAVSDARACEIAKAVRDSIEKRVGSSVPVKITVVRECRFTEVAKPEGN